MLALLKNFNLPVTLKEHMMELVRVSIEQAQSNK